MNGYVADLGLTWPTAEEHAMALARISYAAGYKAALETRL